MICDRQSFVIITDWTYNRRWVGQTTDNGSYRRLINHHHQIERRVQSQNSNFSVSTLNDLTKTDLWTAYARRQWFARSTFWTNLLLSPIYMVSGDGLFRLLQRRLQCKVQVPLGPFIILGSTFRKLCYAYTSASFLKNFNIEMKEKEMYVTFKVNIRGFRFNMKNVQEMCFDYF